MKNPNERGNEGYYMTSDGKLRDKLILGLSRTSGAAWFTFLFSGYLKLWQLQSPKPRLSDKYDVIFIDEAQDHTAGRHPHASPHVVFLLRCLAIISSSLSSISAIMDVLLSQQCGKFLAGDPHQQIYSFRGAINALNTVDHTHTYYLTQVTANLTHTR